MWHLRSMGNKSQSFYQNSYSDCPCVGCTKWTAIRIAFKLQQNLLLSHIDAHAIDTKVSHMVINLESYKSLLLRRKLQRCRWRSCYERPALVRWLCWVCWLLAVNKLLLQETTLAFDGVVLLCSKCSRRVDDN